jgi:hypothetical protein
MYGAKYGEQIARQRWATSSTARVPFPTKVKDFFVPNILQTGFGAQPTSYPMGIGLFPSVG